MFLNRLRVAGESTVLSTALSRKLWTLRKRFRKQINDLPEVCRRPLEKLVLRCQHYPDPEVPLLPFRSLLLALVVALSLVDTGSSGSRDEAAPWHQLKRTLPRGGHLPAFQAWS